MTRRRSPVVRARRTAHRTEVLLGDVRAAQRGRLGARLANRLLGRALGRAMRGIWR
jgi:hypothetical protein